MKILKKKYYVFVVIIILILISTTSLAETLTDGINAVYHKRMSDGAGGYVYTNDKYNIDITEVSYKVNDNKLTLTIKVDGVIEDSGFIVYYLFYMSKDASYLMMYSNGSGVVYCDNDYNISNSAVVTKTFDDTIKGVCSLFRTYTSKVDLYGTAYQYTQSDDPTTAELWVDWNPDAHSDIVLDTNSGDNNKDSGKGTPGFDAIIVFAAIGVVLILLRKNK